MPGFALTTAATVACTHQGQVVLTPGQQQVLAGGAPLVTTSDVNAVAPSCALSGSSPPTPCVKLDFSLAASTRILVHGRPVVLQPAGPGTGTCLSAAQAPQGTPVVSAIQQRVVGT
ncbi:hypothetical protein ACFVYG_10820 [Streptomyces sp. NPDC058256]|uniref:hypothetical protein n=1 Tax=Streptomyces sp. NPDC058256 TaxID=3346408 RepID=UPI0036ECDE18